MIEASKRALLLIATFECQRRYAPDVATIDLGRLRLRPGEVRDEGLEIELEPFVLGGQRYELAPPRLPVDLRISQASGATVFDLRLRAHLTGPCMRCLAFAEVESGMSAREFHDPDAPPADGLRSDYVADEHLDVAALGARRDRARAPRADSLPARLRGPLSRMRKGLERGAARAHGTRARPSLGGARRAPRRAVELLT